VAGQAEIEVDPQELLEPGAMGTCEAGDDPAYGRPSERPLSRAAILEEYWAEQ
jgi:hypothetical protein